MELAQVIASAEAIKTNLARIRQHAIGTVMFVDLVGSTEFKAQHPSEEEWLPRLATFLLATTQIIKETHGRVVKYIGDEVMAFFDGSRAVLNAEHATEQILAFCDEFKEYEYQVKIALDYGKVNMLDFVADERAEIGRSDPQGLRVDRCARIIGKATPNTVLCSKDFKNKSSSKGRWLKAGNFRGKGISGSIEVYQLNRSGCPKVRIGKEMTLPDCLRKLEQTSERLQAIKALRKPVSRIGG